MAKNRTYFTDQKTAWVYAHLLPKTRFEVIDYGYDNDRNEYFVEYIDRPAYTR